MRKPLCVEAQRDVLERGLRQDDVDQVVHRVVDDVPVLARAFGGRDVVSRDDARVDRRRGFIVARLGTHLQVDEQCDQQRTEYQPPLDAVKKRLGMDDNSDSTDDSDKDSTDNSDSTDSDNNSDNDDNNGDNGNGGNSDDPGNGGNTDDPGNNDNPGNDGDMISIAEQYIGQSLDALESACGSPQGSSYEDDPETGKTGFHYYSNFTVSTTVDENGNEIVAGIW